ncbi:MAG: transposase [Chloroflexi bacterium]|nr:transposase [Chloroflexota bacterium]
MADDQDRRHRRSIRLKGYDYSLAGAYFVTISTQDRVCLFGDVVARVMRVNEAGRMVSTEWDALSARFPGIDLDAFVVMANHIHGIIVFATRASVGAPLVGALDTRSSVGAPLVGAQATRASVGAPLVGAQATRASVGAPLVGAQATRASVGAPLVGALDNRATTRVAPTLGTVVGAYKSRVTVEYTRGVKTKGWPAFRRRLWQRNFYEHIIRNEASLHRIRQYILDNPARWMMDRENAAATALEPEGAWLT